MVIDKLNNDFGKLIKNPFFNINNTIRYSMVYQVQPESLSHHISEVSLLGYLIALKLNTEFNEDIDIGKYLEKVLCHDLDEVVTGDIPRTTKYYDDRGLTEFRRISYEVMNNIKKSDNIYKRVVSNWNDAKSGKEGFLLHLVDMLCVAHKVIIELDILGNGYFKKVAKEMVSNLEVLYEDKVFTTNIYDFNKESIEYLKSLIRSAYCIVSELAKCDGSTTYDEFKY